MMKLVDNILGFFSSLSWKVYAAIAALLLVGGTVWYCSSQVEERVEQAEITGEVKEQKRQLEETIKNVETAEEAREDISEVGPTGDRTRYNQCLRTARTPSNCERFLPDVQETNR